MCGGYQNLVLLFLGTIKWRQFYRGTPARRPAILTMYIPVIRVAEAPRYGHEGHSPNS